jgi:uncharacterized protein GlcG (DUF336 family)
MAEEKVLIVTEVEPGELRLAPHTHGVHVCGKKHCTPVALKLAVCESLATKAFCIADGIKSGIAVQHCDGKPHTATIAVAIYSRLSNANNGTMKVWHRSDIFPIAVELARNQAYTAFMLSSSHVATSTRAFSDLSAPGKPFEHYQHGVHPGEYALSRVPGGFPIYCGAHCIGAIGIAGDDPALCERIAKEVLSSSCAHNMMAPEVIRAKGASD